MATNSHSMEVYVSQYCVCVYIYVCNLTLLASTFLNISRIQWRREESTGRITALFILLLRKVISGPEIVCAN